MKLTIIPSDGAVYENGLCYSELVWDGTPQNIHALQFDAAGSTGWLEFNDGNANENITTLPQWAENAKIAWKVAYDEAHKPPAPPEPPTADENKQTAIILLQQSDWTATDDVGNPDKANPYLANQDAFIAYRNEVRQIAINPVAGNIEWPVLPQENWQAV